MAKNRNEINLIRRTKGENGVKCVGSREYIL